MTIPRYVWKHEPEPGYEHDEFTSFVNDNCYDRLTGKRVVSYDLGDPANWDPRYGGWSREEFLQNKQLDPKEQIEANYNVFDEVGK